MNFDFPTDYRIVKHSDITLDATQSLLFQDPSDKNHVYCGAVITEWGEGANCSVFTIEDSKGVRALVVTNGADVPLELLQTKLIGAFVWQEYVGVDSGQVSIYTPQFKRLMKPTHTYIGDGLYPVAMWGRDGHLYAIAVLFDLRYFAEGW